MEHGAKARSESGHGRERAHLEQGRVDGREHDRLGALDVEREERDARPARAEQPAEHLREKRA